MVQHLDVRVRATAVRRVHAHLVRLEFEGRVTIAVLFEVLRDPLAELACFLCKRGRGRRSERCDARRSHASECGGAHEERKIKIRIDVRGAKLRR